MEMSRQGQGVVSEAQEAGAQVIAAEVITTDRSGTMGARVGGALKATVGGKLRPDRHEVFVFDTQGARHLYVQPIAGVTALPGEHHAWLFGSLRSPVAYVPGMLGAKWTSPADPELVSWLNKSQGQLKSVVRGTKLKWKVGMGEIELPWGIQLRSLGDGRSHLAMNAGRYGGFTTVRVGIGHFVKVAHAMSQVLAQGVFPEQEFLHEPAYTELFRQAILEAVPDPDLMNLQTRPEPDGSENVKAYAYVSDIPGRGLSYEEAQALQGQV
jgi:hypothetical protein